MNIEGVSWRLWRRRGSWIAETSLKAIEVVDRTIGLVGVLILKFGDPEDIGDSADHCPRRNNPPNQGGKGDVIAAAALRSEMRVDVGEHFRSLTRFKNNLTFGK